MKIFDVLNNIKPSKDSKSPKATTGSSTIIRSLFSQELHTKESETLNYQTEINNMRNLINQAADSLEKEPSIPNFKRFREVLSSLAKRINAEAYRLEKCGGTPDNPRYYEIITTIDKEADKLYQLIINSQKNNIAITEKVIGIKGLVVDLIT